MRLHLQKIYWIKHFASPIFRIRAAETAGGLKNFTMERQSENPGWERKETKIKLFFSYA